MRIAFFWPAFARTIAQIIRTSAKSLAEKAGAAQYAVHIEEELTPDGLSGGKPGAPGARYGDDSDDYEIYQGVVGRPGIDFPIQSSIPQTSFSCVTFGNGYFADLDTKCQVIHTQKHTRAHHKHKSYCLFIRMPLQFIYVSPIFRCGATCSKHEFRSCTACVRINNNIYIRIILTHFSLYTRTNTETHTNTPLTNHSNSQVFHICEGGKKISFLCPNGTIFQQTDLICDWWFRVNCAQSPDYYADSAEILSRSPPNNNANHFKAIIQQMQATNKTVMPVVARPPAFRPQGVGVAFTARGAAEPTPPSSSLLSGGDASLGDGGGARDERFDLTDMYLTQTRERNTHIRTTMRKLVKPASSSSASASVAAAVVSSPNSLGGSASLTNSAAATADSLETQEVAETASFAHSLHNNAHNSFLTQPIYVRNIQQTQNDTITIKHSISGGDTALPTEQQRTYNLNSIHFGTKQQPLSSAVAATAITTTTTTTTPSPSTAAPSHFYHITTAHPSININNNNRLRGSVQYSGSALKANNYKDEYTTPNQIHFTESNPKTKTTARRLPAKTRATQYYTPTVPTILPRTAARLTASASTSTTTTLRPPAHQPLHLPYEQLENAAKASPSEHAIEMMRILNKLMAGNRLLKDSTAARQAYSSQPSSSGAEDARSLALYFATASDDNAVIKEAPNKFRLDLETVNALDANVNVAIANGTAHINHGLLSNATVRKYDSLFGNNENTGNGFVAAESQSSVAPFVQRLDTAPLVPPGDNRVQLETSGAGGNDAGPPPFLSGVTALDGEPGQPAIRSLAQVFTHALSAYLHDPTTFRQVLSDIRPTEPPPVRSNHRTDRRLLPHENAYATTNSLPSNTDDLEVLDFSDVTVSTTLPTTIDDADSYFPGTTTTPASSPVFGAFESRTNPNDNRQHDNDLSSPTSTAVEVIARAGRPELHYVPSADHVPASRQLTEQLEENARASLQETLANKSRNPLAMEINGAFVVSTSFPYFQDDSSLEAAVRNDSRKTNEFGTTRDGPFFGGGSQTTAFAYPTTTELPITSADFENTAGLLLPNVEPLNLDDNDLQRSASQSFVQAGGNQLLHHHHQQQQRQQRQRQPTQTTATTQPPATTLNRNYGNLRGSTLSYTVFLDPLTINDELQSHGSVTPSLHTYLPKSQKQTTSATFGTTTTDVVPTSINERRGKYAPHEDSATTAPPPPPQDEQFMEQMQERANEMFGSLNNTSAEHLMNVMRKATKNKTVRKLILLLIQTCDEDYSSNVEQSRSALLNALIGMDGKISENVDVKVYTPFKYRRGKSQQQQLDNPDDELSNAAAAAAVGTETPPANYDETATTAPIGTPTQQQTTYTTDGYTYDTPTTAFETPDPSAYWSSDRTTIPTQDPFDYITTTTETSALFSGTGADSWTFPSTYRTPLQEDTNDDDPETATATTTILQRTTTTAAYPTTITTTPPPPPSLPRDPSNQRFQSKRIAKDLDDLLVEGSQSYDPARFRSGLSGHGSGSRAATDNEHSDTRALDLLRSLYALAGKLGK